LLLFVATGNVVGDKDEKGVGANSIVLNQVTINGIIRSRRIEITMFSRNIEILLSIDAASHSQRTGYSVTPVLKCQEKRNQNWSHVFRNPIHLFLFIARRDPPLTT
jgi:hypothetical protein